MPEKTSIEVTRQTWQDLSGQKYPGDSFNDVINRLLANEHREYVAKDDQTACNYGPSSKLEDGWVLDVTTDGGDHVGIHFPEAAMYGLWIEVQGRPWPDRLDEQEEEAQLRRELVDRANGADAETLQDALDAMEP